MIVPRGFRVVSLVALTLTAGCVKSMEVRRFEASAPVTAPAKSRTILFAKVASKVPPGHHIGTLALGYLCENNAAIRWNQATFSETATMVARAFETEAAKAGYRVLQHESDSLFEGPMAGQPDVIEGVQKSVVTVQTESGFGSGFIVSPAGFVVTSAHVVDRASSVKVKLATGQEIAGTVLRRNAATDVALVQLETGTYPVAPLGVSTTLRPGSSVYAIGSPLGQQGTVTRGIVSAVRVEEGRRLIQSDVTIHAGSSGGPLLDERGRVVAITRAGVLLGNFGVGINAFVPIEEAWAGLQVQPQVVDSAPLAPRR